MSHKNTEPAISDAALASMQQHADPLADDTMADILGPWPPGMPSVDAPQWERIATVNRLFGEWTTNASIDGWKASGEGVTPELAQALQDYLAKGQALPDWADARKIERAEKIFFDHGALSCILLFCASLPECYVIPDLSSVLHTAGQLEQHTEYRIRSTAAMIFPVMMHGGLTRSDGAGVAQILKVRLIHATIRNLIMRGKPESAVKDLLAQLNIVGAGKLGALPGLPSRPTMYQALFARGWDLANDGLPCNQEELAYTLLTFGYVFLRSMRRLGIGLAQHDEEAYLHAWNVVGHVLGIERGLMVETMDQGKELMARMQARGRAEPVSPDPRPGLGQALMATMANSIPWDIAKPFPQLMTRFLCGKATASDLGLTQPVPWSSALLFWGVLLVARVIDRVLRLVLPRFSIVRTLTRILGYHFMSRVLMSQTRPLQLPSELLNQVDGVVHSWSDDPHVPKWINRIEDRLTTRGTWSLKLATSARPAATASQPAATAQEPA
ncbi:oxygenase MpaB family protein [Acidovorax sp.]|uniref:oxygenase MpaB family protein n=1 Tax=Acidovorax sp. TaxID=1872122 RepID=UPI002ACE5BCB|nr:oxygenase MpaB family protein [Acidovorax sp.]MDZ7865424.1 oxygenase MpaB family protein [Acidovorax sp.]